MLFRSRVIALLWVLTAVGLIALAVGLSGGGSGPACVGWSSACTAPPHAHAPDAVVPSAGEPG